MTKLESVHDEGSLRVRVFNTLETAIINGELPEGESLNEIKLAETLGVSRTPVREAIMQLELEGLVQTIPNKGATVIGVSEKDAEDIFQIRERIEPFAASLTAVNIEAQELAALEKVVELQEFYLTKNDSDQLWRLDSDFHRIIYSACGNRPLCSMLTSFHNHVKKVRGLTLRSAERAEKSVAEHRGILEAFKSHSADKAESLMREHIRNATMAIG